jgi:hypothetical protein
MNEVKRCPALRCAMGTWNGTFKGPARRRHCRCLLPRRLRHVPLTTLPSWYQFRRAFEMGDPAGRGRRDRRTRESGHLAGTVALRKCGLVYSGAWREAYDGTVGLATLWKTGALGRCGRRTAAWADGVLKARAGVVLPRCRDLSPRHRPKFPTVGNLPSQLVGASRGGVLRPCDRLKTPRPTAGNGEQCAASQPHRCVAGRSEW